MSDKFYVVAKVFDRDADGVVEKVIGEFPEHNLAYMFQRAYNAKYHANALVKFTIKLTNGEGDEDDAEEGVPFSERCGL